ncbi:type 1 glutamine amidotransferase domain-containing protein [Paenibacillus donghaensis]|uniref:type 1 glutamine amidotransferase domain-containing protein n=1 Tax=Paenibacillus donghaensis TaxID=414771 RepID=UPI001FE24754|nr:type 1 glutamine amidotransferase domain-containing protein [Paenibacillus donghaensis]
MWLSEATHFIEVFDKHDVVIDLVSPKGGDVPLDPKSLGAVLDKSTKAYFESAEFMGTLKNTMTPEQVDAESYDAIYFTGGHGTMFDFPDNASLLQISRAIYDKGGIVSAVCHGVGALLNIKHSDGTPWISGKKLTGFANIEEKMAKQEEGRLITGQNPQSAKR